MIRLKKTKAVLAAAMLFSATTGLVGCSSEDEVRGPIADYLKNNYGIQDFTILSDEYNWFETGDHQTHLLIQKPYPAYVYLVLGRDKDRRIQGDDVYAELFTSAFAEQHPRVFAKSEELVKKYKLFEKSPFSKSTPNVIQGDPYYFVDTKLKEAQETQLVEQFKKTHEIKTDALLPTLEQGDPVQGVVDFTYYFNTYHYTGEVPKADSLVQDFAESRVLPEGTFSVNIKSAAINENGGSSIGIDQNYSSVLFRVNGQGDVQVLKTVHGEDEYLKASSSKVK
ncbi:hypothetical protein [Tumebacillus flagellatus]|uniref:Lipoprotein n=1 Tax=Tumebacillus flagellatus TaxID=1157490 RepID=A0A074MC81_9BACL|nr:hypothetical protein [Tumebacillus flagellatus]KEO83497.1 hypothetical protein EL26_09845 [Tumebacillus flagellatus]